MKSLKLFAAAALAASGLAVSPLALPGQPITARAEQQLPCFTSYKANGDVHVHNGCGRTVWWTVCVTWSDTGSTEQFNMMGLVEGDDSMNPGHTAETPYTYRLLTSDTLSGWFPKC